MVVSHAQASIEYTFIIPDLFTDDECESALTDQMFLMLEYASVLAHFSGESAESLLHWGQNFQKVAPRAADSAKSGA